jgi:hypothetical protein
MISARMNVRAVSMRLQKLLNFRRLTKTMSAFGDKQTSDECDACWLVVSRPQKILIQIKTRESTITYISQRLQQGCDAPCSVFES